MRIALRRSPLCIVFASAIIAAGFNPYAAQAQVASTTEANVPVELTFTASETYGDPFNEVDLDVVFTDPAGKQLHVPAFWAGANVWKARYASPVVGAHQFRTECSKGSDRGLQSVTGAVEIKPYAGDNPLYTHGPIHVASNRRTFEHADGKPFLWLGDTWWMGLCHRMHWPEDIHKLAADRKAKGFNVIQIVAGLYPDMAPFDPRGANEAGFPWEPDFARIRPEYFAAADQRIQYLVDQGFTPCIVGAWGYFIPLMGVEKAKQHWQYLIARYGALPVVWCAAGEANLPYYLAEGFPYDDRQQVADWTEVMRFIRGADPFQRPLTIHPTGLGRLSSRHAVDDPALLDFDMLQTPHGQREAVEPTVRTVQESYADTPAMPVINGEAAYEMLSDSLPTQWTRQMFWLCMTNGAAGHTYGANGIWQCNRRDQPHGPSPHHAPGVGYGKIPWDEAMNLPGSTQVALGKKLFEKYEWHKFQPRPEWSHYAPNPAGHEPEWGQWIWFPEGQPATDAPAAKRFFRKTFDVVDREPSARATLWVAADDQFVAYVNGQRVGSHAGWQSPQSIDVTAALRQGENVLAIEAENVPVPSANPAGLLASLQIRSSAGKKSDVHSDASWRCTEDVAATPDWTAPNFDDQSWVAAKELGAFGQPPWGKFHDNASYGPYATGIPGNVRLIYVPVRQAVQVSQLESNAKYRAYTFDPTSGKTTEPTKVTPNEKGEWTSPPPSHPSDADDWVLILELD